MANGWDNAIYRLGEDLCVRPPRRQVAAKLVRNEQRWLALDAEGYAVFRAHLDRVADLDEDTWARARGWALCVGTAIAANSGDNPRMAAIGAHAIERVLAEP